MSRMQRRPFPPLFALLVAAVMFSSSANAGLIAFDAQTPLAKNSTSIDLVAMWAAADADPIESIHQADDDGMSMSVSDQSGVGVTSLCMISSAGILISKPTCCHRFGFDGKSRLPEAIPISLLKIPIC